MRDINIKPADELAASMGDVYGDHLQDEKSATVWMPTGSNLAPLPPPYGVGVAYACFVRIEDQAEPVAAIFSPRDGDWLTHNLPVKVKFKDGWYRIQDAAPIEIGEATGGDYVQPTFAFRQHNHEDAAGGGALSAAAIQSGTLSVARGGTGQAALTANSIVIGNGTSAVSGLAPGTSGNVVQSNGTSWLSQALSVVTAQIADLAVTTAKLADGAVTAIKLASDAVTTAKIADGNVTKAKIDSLAFASPYELGTGTPNKVRGTEITAETKLFLPLVAPSADAQIAFTDNRAVVYARGMAQRIVAAPPIGRVVGAIQNTTAETLIHDAVLVIPANGWNIGTVIRCKFFGRVVNGTAGAVNLTSRAKASTVVAATTVTSVPAGTNTAFIGEYTIACLATGATGFIAGAMELVRGDGSLPQTTAPPVEAIDTTSSKNVQFTVQWASASASLAITFHSLTMEIIN